LTISLSVKRGNRLSGRSRGGRPAVIVSGPLHLSLPHAVVFVVPVTSRDRGLRHQIAITSQASGRGGTRPRSLLGGWL